MKVRCAALLAVVGLAASVHAQVINVGTLTVTGATTVTNLNGASIPAGTYKRYTIGLDFSTPGDAWSEEARAELASSATFAGSTVYTRQTYSPRYIYTGGNTFAAPAPVHIDWTGQMPLATPYIGGQPLFLHTQQIAGDTGMWANTIVTLSTSTTALPPVAVTIPAITFPALGNPSNVLSTSVTLAGAPGVGDVKWVKFTVPAGGLSAGNGRYLDIDTEGSTLTDPLIALFQSNGEFVSNGGAAAYNDDGGSNFQSQLSFGGATSPRPAVANGLAYNGRNGLIAAGDYYLAVTNTSNFAWTVIIPGFTVYPGDDENGDVTINVRTGTATAPAACVGPRETEPNDTKATGNAITLSDGSTLCASSALATGAGQDFFRISVPTAAGVIRRNILGLTSDTPGHALSLRGHTQTNGVINADDLAVQNAVITATGREVMWFTMGNSAAADARVANVLVAGNESTGADYKLTMASTVETPIESGVTVDAGSVTLSTVGVGVNTNDTDMYLLDGNLNIIPGAGSDDANANTFNSEIVTTLSAGTYYLAISNYNLLVAAASPATDAFRGGNVIDNPGVIANSSTSIATDLTTLISSNGGAPQVVVAAKTRSYDVRFIKFTVGGGVVTRCQPADIADDAGNPLPSAGPNNGVNEGDYNAFFNNFFTNQAVGSPADIASDDGTPLPPFGPAGLPNNGVNEGDYNAFFNNFFAGCP
ncbi:hypothetical protein BH11PLA1_BH11PLA1_23440 [soil metagenome]